MKTLFWALVFVAGLYFGSGVGNGAIDIAGVDWSFEQGIEGEDEYIFTQWTKYGWNSSDGGLGTCHTTAGITPGDYLNESVVWFNEGDQELFAFDDPSTHGFMAFTSKPFTVEKDISYAFNLNMKWESAASESDHLFILVHNSTADIDNLYSGLIYGSGSEIWTNHYSSGYATSSYGEFLESDFTSGYFLSSSDSYALTIMLAYDGYKPGISGDQGYSNFAFDSISYMEVVSVPAPAAVILAGFGTIIIGCARRLRK